MSELSEKERLAVLDTHIPNISRSLDEMRGSLLRQERATGEVQEKIAVMTYQQEQNLDYQTTCEIDRKSQETRLNKVENKVANQIKWNAGISSVCATIFAGIVGWIFK